MIQMLMTLEGLPDQESIAVVNNSWDIAGGQDVLAAISQIGGKINTLATPGRDAGRNGKGLPFVFAAGNDGRSVARGATPLAALESVVAVSNIDPNGLRHGPPDNISNYGPWITLSASGEQVFTTTPCTGPNCHSIVDPAICDIEFCLFWIRTDSHCIFSLTVSLHRLRHLA